MNWVEVRPPKLPKQERPFSMMSVQYQCFFSHENQSNPWRRIFAVFLVFTGINYFSREVFSKCHGQSQVLTSIFWHFLKGSIRFSCVKKRYFFTGGDIFSWVHFFVILPHLTSLFQTRLASLAFGRAQRDPKGEKNGFKAQNASHSR